MATIEQRSAEISPKPTSARSISAKYWVKFRRWPVFPVAILVVMAICALFANFIAPHPPFQSSLREAFTPPFWMDGGSTKYLLGSDDIGRDVLSRIIHGARISMTVALVAVASGMTIGVALGVVSGYVGGMLDEVIMRIVDIWMAIPFILFALIVIIVFGQSMTIIVILMALLAWSAFVRNIRAEVLVLREAEYVMFSKVSGASPWRIMWRHITPSIINTTIVIVTLRVGQLILAEASLSFLGAGIPDPTPAWGVMVASGRNYVSSAWWVSFFPGVAIFLVVMALNFFGDWMRDRLDPRLRQL